MHCRKRSKTSGTVDCVLEEIIRTVSFGSFDVQRADQPGFGFFYFDIGPFFNSEALYFFIGDFGVLFLCRVYCYEKVHSSENLSEISNQLIFTCSDKQNTAPVLYCSHKAN
jgi:hypothetical protein